MDEKTLTDGESRFMEIIWEEEPVPSGRLVTLCLERLGWKKSTTYTMLKRLGDKGCLRIEGGLVTTLRSRAQVRAEESARVVERSFSGSLPGFLVAFLGGKTLTEKEAAEIKALIDAHTGEEDKR